MIDPRELNVLNRIFQECEPDPLKRAELVRSCRAELRVVARKYTYLVFAIAQATNLELGES